MKHVILGLSFVTLLFAFVISSVSAHVTVNPREVITGYQVASVRVANEKDVPTTSIRVVVPHGVNVHGVKPVAGWTYSVKRETTTTQQGEEAGHDHEEAEGRINEVIWNGGEIDAGEFEEFPLSVQYTKDGTYAWKAYQTYGDGEVVPWDDTNEDRPASKITVLKEAKVDTLTNSVNTLQEDRKNSIGIDSTWVSIGAFLLAFAAFAVALKKR